MVELFIACPFCREQRANYSLQALWALPEDTFGRLHEDAVAFGYGNCFVCNSRAVLYFSCGTKLNKRPYEGIALQGFRRLKKGISLGGTTYHCVETFPPQGGGLDMPEGLSDAEAVEEALVDGDIAFQNRRWRSAVTGYCTAIDFAATEILGDAAETLPLGGKIGKLKESERIPSFLAEHFESSNLERRMSVHYREQVSEEVASYAREVAVEILKNLFTYPWRQKQAEERMKKARMASTPTPSDED